VFVSPSIIAQTEAVVEEALRNGSWLDVSTVLPPSLGPSDVAQLLDKCTELSRDTEHKRGQVRWQISSANTHPWDTGRACWQTVHCHTGLLG